MKPGDLAIVASNTFTLCYTTFQAGKALTFAQATEHMLGPGDYAIIVGNDIEVSNFNGTQFSLVLALCKFGLVSLNPYSLVILEDW
jgi:hypothetical protein